MKSNFWDIGFIWKDFDLAIIRIINLNINFWILIIYIKIIHNIAEYKFYFYNDFGEYLL